MNVETSNRLLADEITVDRRALKAEIRKNGDTYEELSEAELHAISYCTTAEIQHRHGDRTTTHWLAFLAQRLPEIRHKPAGMKNCQPAARCAHPGG